MIINNRKALFYPLFTQLVEDGVSNPTHECGGFLRLFRDAITTFLNAKWLEDHKDARDFVSRVERSTGISFVDDT